MPLHEETPYVVTAHDLSYERFPEFYSWRRRLWHRLMRPLKLMQGARHIIAVSQATKDDVVALYGIKEEQVTVIYSGVKIKSKIKNEHSKLRQDDGAIRPSVIDSLPDSFVLFLGVQEPRKNIPSIIEAYSEIANDVKHDLVIAGSSGWLVKEIDQAYSVSPVKNRIHRLGFVSEADKWELYARADLFVYPSFYEGFGFPPLESLMAGRPVITSGNSALSEIVGKWATLVDPYDVGELALVMKELLGDLPAVAVNVRNEVVDLYSWRRAAQQTIAVLS